MPRNWQNDTRKMVRDEKAKLAGFSNKPKPPEPKTQAQKPSKKTKTKRKKRR